MKYIAEIEIEADVESGASPMVDVLFRLSDRIRPMVAEDGNAIVRIGGIRLTPTEWDDRRFGVQRGVPDGVQGEENRP